jgi:hypothetical protein
MSQGDYTASEKLLLKQFDVLNDIKVTASFLPGFQVLLSTPAASAAVS